MPMVSESKTAAKKSYSLVRWDGAPLIAEVPSGTTKQQTGYRSGRGLPREVRAGIGNKRSETWGSSLRIVQDLNVEYNSRPGRQASIVNSRDYKVYGNDSYQTSWGTSSLRNGTWVHDAGTTALSLQAYAAWDPQLFPSDADLESQASSMFRQSVPGAPAFDLARFLFELRDIPKFFSGGNYFPRRGREAGSAYLNYVFGLAPTGKDLAALAHAVIRSADLVRDFINHENQQVTRRRSREIGRVVYTEAPYRPSGTGSHQHVIRDGTITWGNVTMWAPPAGRDLLGTRICPFQIQTLVHATSELRQFATFEYFVPRPSGIMARIDGYVRRASLVLGSGLSAAAVYELSPWTWMLDWFFDIGGLLQYQETVATNSVVATRSGWVHEVQSTVEAYMFPTTSRFTTIDVGAYSMLSAGSTIQKRRAGGPFSISQPWGLSVTQKAIVAALAVSRYSPF